MTPHAQLMIGIILLTVPTIQYGGYFLLTILTGKQTLQLTDFQKSMFRAGHAHAGVLVILSILAEWLINYAGFGPVGEWTARIGFPLAAILVSGGFFGAAAGRGRSTPGALISILYAGVLVLAACLILLGVGLLSNR